MNPPVIPWKNYLKENDFITTELPYKEGTYYNLFEEKVFHTNDRTVGDLRYYVYDPTKHGFESSGRYPVIYAFHGASASLHGITAVNWAGVEYFASPEYQERMGGAYIICPLANEYLDDGELRSSWMTPITHNVDLALEAYPEGTDNRFKAIFRESGERFLSLLGTNSIYTEALHRLFQQEISTFSSAGKTIIFGTSAGGYCAWRYIISYKVDAALIMAPAYQPSDAELELLEDEGTEIWFCQGKHDECVPYMFSVSPILEKMKSMKNVSLYLPELVRVSNGGVYSNPADIEMGQHCINNAAQCDFMYSDGTPMDVQHPEGITGWIRGKH